MENEKFNGWAKITDREKYHRYKKGKALCGNIYIGNYDPSDVIYKSQFKEKIHTENLKIPPSCCCECFAIFNKIKKLYR